MSRISHLKSQLRCWNCDGPHLVRFCPKNKNAQFKIGNAIGRVNKAAVKPSRTMNEITESSPNLGHHAGSGCLGTCPGLAGTSADCASVYDHVTNTEPGQCLLPGAWHDVADQCCAKNDNLVY